LHNNISRPE